MATLKPVVYEVIIDTDKPHDCKYTVKLLATGNWMLERNGQHLNLEKKFVTFGFDVYTFERTELAANFAQKFHKHWER